jgi:hypothetical protein
MRDPNDTTIIVTTFNRSEMCRRAVDSALAQTQECRVMVANDGDPLPSETYTPACYYPTARADHWYLTVYDAVYRANTPYVTVLCDDDWLEPTFLERCFDLWTDDTAYVFTNSTIHYADGTVMQHWGNELTTGTEESGTEESELMGRFLLGQERIITPSCCLYRRDDVLRYLTPGGVPGFINAMPYCHNPSGPDHLMALLPLLHYPKVGYVADPLCNLDGGEQSTTVGELLSDDKGEALRQNYTNSRILYFALREVNKQLGAHDTTPRCPSCDTPTTSDSAPLFGCSCGAQWQDARY